VGERLDSREHRSGSICNVSLPTCLMILETRMIWAATTAISGMRDMFVMIWSSIWCVPQATSASRCEPTFRSSKTSRRGVVPPDEDGGWQGAPSDSRPNDRQRGPDVSQIQIHGCHDEVQLDHDVALSRAFISGLNLSFRPS